MDIINQKSTKPKKEPPKNMELRSIVTEIKNSVRGFKGWFKQAEGESAIYQVWQWILRIWETEKKNWWKVNRTKGTCQAPTTCTTYALWASQKKRKKEAEKISEDTITKKNPQIWWNTNINTKNFKQMPTGWTQRNIHHNA